MRFAFWKTSASVFDPTTLPFSSYWRANFSGAPWAAVASAGVSGTTGALVTAGSDPTNGTAQNGRVPAAFASASSQYLQNATPMSTLFTAGAGTIIALVYFVSQNAADPAVYQDAAILCDDNVGNMGLSINSTGANAFIFDAGGYKSVLTAAPVSTGAYHLLMMRWDSANIGITADSLAEVTLAAGAATGLTGSVYVGRSYLGVNHLNGRILELGTAASKFSNTDYANYKSYCNATCALAL